MEDTRHKSKQVGRTYVRLRETKEIALSFETFMGNVPTMPRSLGVQRREFPAFIAPRELLPLSWWQRGQLGKWTLTYDVQEQLVNISDHLDTLFGDISLIKSELDECKRSIGELHEKLETRPIVKQTNITEIGNGFKVKIPIPVTIEEYDDEVTASVAEIELYASGATEGEAISRLKKEIGELYNELLKTPKDELGYLPLAWLRVMEATIEKHGQTR